MENIEDEKRKTREACLSLLLSWSATPTVKRKKRWPVDQCLCAFTTYLHLYQRTHRQGLIVLCVPLSLCSWPFSTKLGRHTQRERKESKKFSFSLHSLFTRHNNLRSTWIPHYPEIRTTEAGITRGNRLHPYRTLSLIALPRGSAFKGGKLILFRRHKPIR